MILVARNRRRSSEPNLWREDHCQDSISRAVIIGEGRPMELELG